MEFFSEANGLLYSASGFNALMRWDGRSAQMVEAGIAAPSTALSMTGSGRGHIVGDKFAYVRFKDDLDNVSDLSPISDVFEADDDGGDIEGATAATPIVITTDDVHGLATGDFVKIADVGGNTDANGLWEVTVIDSTSFSLDTSSGNTAYSGGGTWRSGIDTITYSSVPVPTDAKVTIRQILRNLDGNADVFYVDVETTDLSSTSFQSTRDDNELAAQEKVSIFDTDGSPLANTNGIPPNHKTTMAFINERMFYLGEEDYNHGSVKVTFGSATVTGVGTAWTAALDGRFFHAEGSSRRYLIDSVDTSAQTLTLSEGYDDATNNFASYAIRSADPEFKTFYWSKVGKPEAVLATDALTIRENGDRIVSGFTNGPYLFIVENRHLHRMTFGQSPAIDGGIFEVSNRGTVNNRCHVAVGENVYFLDEQGIWAYTGNEDSMLSETIQDIFRTQSRSRWRVNWNFKKAFHCVFFQPQEVIRWFVCLDGNTRPHHCVAYSIPLKRFWIEEFNRPITASCAGRLNGIPTVFLGSDARQVFAFWQGYLDVATGAGTKRGTATSAALLSLTDSTANFGSTAVGAPLDIVDGVGKGQRRRIVAKTATVLTINLPWTILPDDTSVYQVGGVDWMFRTKRYEFLPKDSNSETGIDVTFQPQTQEATMDVQVYQDFSRAAVQWRNPISTFGGDGVRVDRGKTAFVMDLTDQYGNLNKRFDRHSVKGLSAPRYAEVELSGVTNDDATVIYELSIDGVR